MTDSIMDTTIPSRDALRPGGVDITLRALEFCEFAPGSRMLDIGCGRGATLELLTSFGFDTYGLDASRLRVEQSRGSSDHLLQSDARSIPFMEGYFDCVFLECTLSVIANPDRILSEIYRVLKPGAFLVFSDIFARNALSIPPLKAAMAVSPIRSLWSQSEIENLLNSHSLRIHLREENNVPMRRSAYISQNPDLDLPESELYCLRPRPSVDALSFHLLLSRARIGYLLLVAQKMI
jgi:arsenite methyltransferase